MPWALRLLKVFLLVTLVVSKSAPGGEWWVGGENEISVCVFKYFLLLGAKENALITIFTPCVDQEWNLHHCAYTLRNDPSQTPDSPPIVVEGKMKIP